MWDLHWQWTYKHKPSKNKFQIAPVIIQGEVFGNYTNSSFVMLNILEKENLYNW